MSTQTTVLVLGLAAVGVIAVVLLKGGKDTVINVGSQTETPGQKSDSGIFGSGISVSDALNVGKAFDLF